METGPSSFDPSGEDCRVVGGCKDPARKQWFE